MTIVFVLALIVLLLLLHYVLALAWGTALIVTAIVLVIGLVVLGRVGRRWP